MNNTEISKKTANRNIKQLLIYNVNGDGSKIAKFIKGDITQHHIDI